MSLYTDWLMHYGRSIKDGAPGVGTGNWRRGGSSSEYDSVRERMMTKHPLGHPSEKSYGISEKDLKEHPLESINHLKKQDGKRNIEELRDNINHPDGYDDDLGRLYNCPNCAAAFELVERGYDVCARPKKDGSNVENIESFFVGGKLKNTNHDAYDAEYMKMYSDYKKAHEEYEDFFYKNYGVNTRAVNKERDRLDQIESDLGTKFYVRMSEIRRETGAKTEEALKAQGDGARGIMVVAWAMDDDPNNRSNAFHAFNYKVEDGEVKFFDSQTDDWFSQNGRDSELNGWYEEADPRESYYMRTDNLKLAPAITSAVYSNRSKK